MIKLRKSKILTATVAGLILAGTVSTVAMAGRNSNDGNLLSRCRNMLCAENGACSGEKQCMSGGVCERNRSCVKNETCVNKGQCMADGTCVNGNHPEMICGSAPQCGGEGFRNETGSYYDSRERYCENRENDGYHHGDVQNHGGRHEEHH